MNKKAQMPDWIWYMWIATITLGVLLLIVQTYNRSADYENAKDFCESKGLLFISSETNKVECAIPNTTQSQIYYIDLSKKQVRE